MRGIFWLDAEELPLPQGLCSMEIVLLGAFFFSVILYNSQCKSTNYTVTDHWTLLNKHFQAKWLLYEPPCLTHKNSTFCRQIAFLWLLWITEQTVPIYINTHTHLNHNSWLIDIHYLHYRVRPRFGHHQVYIYIYIYIYIYRKKNTMKDNWNYRILRLE